MDGKDKDLIRRLAVNNHELSKLYQEHQALDKRLAKLDRMNFRTSAEEVELKQLKSEKLKGVDKMMSILLQATHVEGEMFS